MISLPSGVFRPYAGVSTAIIIFAKGGKTENVFFYNVQSDGFSLDDKRAKIGDGKGDLPDVRTKYLQWCEGKGSFSDRKNQAFEVPVDDIIKQNYDLSINRYRDKIQVVTMHDKPEEILERLFEIENEIAMNLSQLKEMLK